ncbi:MAG: hypothetical protein H0V09_03270, partial [Gemmatimonadetes bacterium]|nr:hypothetical protein [Gemmatimonadota bacterium]
FSDATIYARQASALAAHGWGALRQGVQDYTLLYPLLISPAFALGSRAEAHHAALAINSVVSTSALFPVYWISRRVLPAGVSLALTAAIALLPALFVYALALSAENLFLPLFWWGTFALLRLAERDRASDALAAGLALGLLPAVKLTGFAILAAAAATALGMAALHRVEGRRIAAFLTALVLPQVAWVLLRVLLAAPERGLFGFGPGVGEQLVGRITSPERESWSVFLSYSLNEASYFLAGAYVAWLAFSLYLVSQYRTWRSRSTEGFVLLWTFLCAAALFAVTVFLLYPIAQSLTDPEQRARSIYGRFIEVLFPAFFILGTRGMIDFAWKERGPRAPGRELFLVLATVVFTAVSFYPLTRYAVARAFMPESVEWLGVRVPLGLGVLGLLLAAALGALAVLRTGRRGRTGFAVALAGVLAVHALVFGVTTAAVVRGAQVRDRTLFRIGHHLARVAGPRTAVVWDAELGFSDQFFAYRFWSDTRWEVVSSDRLAQSRSEYVVTRRRLAHPVEMREANGVTLYRIISGE